jgi:hypothetical protein
MSDLRPAAFQGVFAPADTWEACRDGLASTREDWRQFRISRQLPISGLRLGLAVKKEPHCARMR